MTGRLLRRALPGPSRAAIASVTRTSEHRRRVCIAITLLQRGAADRRGAVVPPNTSAISMIDRAMATSSCPCSSHARRCERSRLPLDLPPTIMAAPISSDAADGQHRRQHFQARLSQHHAHLRARGPAPRCSLTSPDFCNAARIRDEGSAITALPPRGRLRVEISRRPEGRCATAASSRRGRPPPRQPTPLFTAVTRQRATGKLARAGRPRGNAERERDRWRCPTLHDSRGWTDLRSPPRSSRTASRKPEMRIHGA